MVNWKDEIEKVMVGQQSQHRQMYFSPSPNRLRPLREATNLLGDIEDVDGSGRLGNTRRPLL